MMMMMISRFATSLLLVLSFMTTAVSAFGVGTTSTTTITTITTTTSSRAEFLQSVGTAAATAAILIGHSTVSNAVTTTTDATTKEVTLPNGVRYIVLKQGTGPKPERGELVAIRFAAYNGDIQIDNIFDTPEPYYTRLGSGGLIPGVESTLPLMQLGDRWKMTIPVRQ
jgi:FKBP-type peptidyl-prolyl cis-trans isomerase